MNRGKYIVIEGPEGVGKTTQLRELAHRLQAAGLPVRQLREPDSQSDLTARAIRQLTQDPRYPMNTRTEVLLYNAARAQSLSIIKQSVEHGVICLVDRNYLTTLAIQYYGRGDVPDYQTINAIISFAVGGVEPDLCVVLDAPVNTLRARLKDRYNGERFDNLDDAFLERVRAGYLWEAKQRNLPVVFATDEQSEVANNIWRLVSDTLAIRETNRAAETAAPASIKQIIEQKTIPSSPPVADKQLPVSPQPVRQDDKGSIDAQETSYLLAPLLTTAKMTFTGKANFYVPDYLQPDIKGQYSEALNGIFETYAAMHTRLTAHILGNDVIPNKQRAEAMRLAAQDQASDCLSSVLPLATLSSVTPQYPDQNYDNFIAELLASELPEANHLGQSLKDNASESVPVMMPDGSVQDGSDALSKYRRQTDKHLQTLAEEHLPDSYATPPELINLVDFWPKNELLLLPGMLYQHANHSLDSLQAEINTWPYDLKSEVFSAYVGKRSSPRQRPGKALEKAHYSWDMLTDYSSFIDIQQNLKADDLGRQLLTPRYGYDIPELVEKAGLIDQFESCFDTSLKLYSLLQQAGYPLEAQYATLMGHKMRWKATYNAREAFRLLEASYDNPAAETLTAKMYQKLAEVHPILADTITFANHA